MDIWDSAEGNLAQRNFFNICQAEASDPEQQHGHKRKS